MDGREFAGALPLEVSQGTAPTQYQLIEVGPIRPQQAGHFEPEALVSFSAIHPGARAAPDAERILQPVPMQLAALLVPGSVWSSSGSLIDEGLTTYTGRRQLMLGKRAPALCRLAQLFPVETSRPAFLQSAASDAWYAVINGGKEQLLVPCFELLRAFCYQEAGGLSNYLFSRLPLDALCWPLAAPSRGNDYTAYLCVAAQSLLGQEAVVLAELLFNSRYRDSIYQAHLHLAATWHECEAARKLPHAYVRVPFELGRNVKAQALGVSFNVGKQRYFWVSRLMPSPTWPLVKRVVYHPLGDSSENRSPFSTKTQPAFRDVLHGRRPTPKTLPVLGLPESFWQFGRRLPENAFWGARLPVHRSFRWAKRIPNGSPPVFADSQVLDHLWSRPGYTPIGKEPSLPHNLFFQQVCTHLRQLGCHTNAVEINNPGRRFGPGRSVFPYVLAPHPTTHLPDGRYRPLSIACIQWGGGNFYLLNVLDEKELVLFYHKNLIKQSAKECNDILKAAVSVGFSWEYITRKLPYVQSHELMVFAFVFDVDWVSASILTSLKHAISYYNLSAEFSRQIANLDLSHAPSDYEQIKMIDEVHQNIHNLSCPGDRIGEPLSKVE